MTTIDWRQLYAANRAAIERHRAPVASGPPSPETLPDAGLGRGGRGHPPAARVRPFPAFPPLGRPGGQALTGPDDAPQGGGTWESVAYQDGGRSRSVFVYTPPTLAPAAAAGLVVMLHGCSQTAARFAAETTMNRAADRHGFVVLYPEQSHQDNQQSCWNWFLAAQQQRGAGEPRLIAGAVRVVMDMGARWQIDPGRVFVAGLSAGGAMAAVMAATYPELFAALGVHSGLAYGSATSLQAAHGAMAHGGPDPGALGRAAHAAMGRRARAIPAIVVHGSADRVVAPVNGDRLVQQWMATDRLAAPDTYDPDFARPAEVSRGRVDGGHAYLSRRWTDRRGRLMQEYLTVDGLAHAWSGGAAGGLFADPRGPDASEAIWDFFARTTAGRE
jgi:poly(hydroxyalkanoate) depolymerase family esterase